MTVFEDFLAYVIHGFSPGVPPLKSWKYKRKQNAEFMRMFCEWLSGVHADVLRMAVADEVNA